MIEATVAAVVAGLVILFAYYCFSTPEGVETQDTSRLLFKKKGSYFTVGDTTYTLTRDVYGGEPIMAEDFEVEASGSSIILVNGDRIPSEIMEYLDGDKEWDSD